MVPPLVMALLVSERPLVFGELGFTVMGADGVAEIGATWFDDFGSVDEVFTKTGTAVGVEPGAGVVVGVVCPRIVGRVEDAIGLGRAEGAGFTTARGLGVFRVAVLSAGAFGADAFSKDVFSKDVLSAAVFSAGVFSAAALGVPEADPMVPVVTEAMNTAPTQRATVRFGLPGSAGKVAEVRCLDMHSPYGMVLKPHWETTSSFQQLPQRFLRLGS
jgi:hypothetical protein